MLSENKLDVVGAGSLVECKGSLEKFIKDKSFDG